MSLLSEHIVEAHRTALEPRSLDSELSHPLFDESAQTPRLGYSRKIPFHVRHEARDPCLAESRGQDLKGDGRSGTCRSSDKAMPVGHLPDDGKRSVLAMGYPKPVLSVVHRCQFYSID